MKSRGKRFFKRLFKIGKIPALIGLGLFIGLAIGAESSSVSHIVIKTDSGSSDELAREIEQRIEQRIEERIVAHTTTAPLPDMPPIPEIPEIPASPDFYTNVQIEHTPSFWDVLNGIGTILASLILIGLGGKMLLRHRQKPREKSPESVGV